MTTEERAITTPRRAHEHTHAREPSSMPVPGELEVDPWRESKRLMLRAKEVIPGGGHLSARPLLANEDGPLFMSHGAGSRVWDVDGNEYVDMFMGFGPFLLGYGQREVDAAAVAQLPCGHLLSMSHPLHVRFVEALLDWFPGAEMGAFFKTGSEATTAALRIARHATGRRRVVRCGYHGWHDWCLPRESFVPDALAEQVLELSLSDPPSLDAMFDAHPGEIAAVIVAPEMAHDACRERFEALITTTQRHGAVFVLDEVKTAFRTKPGSMQQRLGIEPDLTTVSKALGNGWPVAAVLGKREIMRSGAGLHCSATFHGETASMAAALKVMEVIRRDAVDEYVWSLGLRLIDGLNAVSKRNRVAAVAFGEPTPAMPFLRFELPDAKANALASEHFYRSMLKQGFLLHPRHMWFVSGAHTVEEIDRLLDTADHAMNAL